MAESIELQAQVASTSEALHPGLVDHILHCIEHVEVRGASPNTIRMSTMVYSRLFIGRKGGNSHQRRVEKRRLYRFKRHIVWDEHDPVGPIEGPIERYIDMPRPRNRKVRAKLL